MMESASNIQILDLPVGIPRYNDATLEARPLSGDASDWLEAQLIAVQVSQPNASGNDFHHHTVAVTSVDFKEPVIFRAKFNSLSISSCSIRPRRRQVDAVVDDEGFVTFVLQEALDVMLEPNGDKWNAIHIVCNPLDLEAPTADTEDIWYFGPGLNQGSAYQHVIEGDGVNLWVPSGKTVYLAPGAFITCRINFVDVFNAAVRGHGCIYSPQGGYVYREHGGAIHMSNANNIEVEGVMAIDSKGFSLSAGQCRDVHVNHYRSFSSAGNGDGIDFFCSSNILVENCFLRNSDDCIALYSHRWDWYGDSENIVIRDCVLLPDMAHAINVGTHGNPSQPETTSNVSVSNIDILDQEENQQWYQGTIALNAADLNELKDFTFENITVEKITRGQLVNIRTMQNAMWTTAPGGSVRNIKFKNLTLEVSNCSQLYPSMILGYDQTHPVDNITFENLKIGDQIIHEGMKRPRWYMIADLVPLFQNEHAHNVTFTKAM